MKKKLKSQLKKWKIGDYVRQFSIVMGGVLLTLWLTGRITDAARQREVRQAMQLVAIELNNNLEMVRDYSQIFTNEKRMALNLKTEGFSSKNFPADTLRLYEQRLFSGLGRPYRLSTDALEMLKTSGLTSFIGDKELVFDLLRSYTSLANFDSTMELYFDMRKQVLVTYKNTHPQTSTIATDKQFAELFDQQLADPYIQDWLYTLPRSFDMYFFDRTATQIEAMITKLEKTYQ